jgi:mannose-6-phosphate isomerase-like protein (cupin superfamily)
MAGEHRDFQSRLIVTGLDAEGRSTFVSDGLTADRLVADGYTRNHLWQATEVPTPVMAPNGPGDASIIPPPPAGYNYGITAFAPDSEWDYEGGYARMLADSGVADAANSTDAPGMHTTDSIDIVTVISGEASVLLETGETTMRQGDTIVQRGTKHAWRNRTDKPCVISAVHVSVIR